MAKAKAGGTKGKARGRGGGRGRIAKVLLEPVTPVLPQQVEPITSMEPIPWSGSRGIKDSDIIVLPDRPFVETLGTFLP